MWTKIPTYQLNPVSKVTYVSEHPFSIRVNITQLKYIVSPGGIVSLLD